MKSWANFIPLCLFILLACDPPSSSGENEGVGADGDDFYSESATDGCGDPQQTDDGMVCVPESPAMEASLLDAGRCIHQDSRAVLGECRPDGRLYRTCDAVFLTWCQQEGGDVEACDEHAPPLVPARCGAGDPTVGCGPLFFDACDTTDGTLACDSVECSTAFCVPPPIAKITFCCGGVTFLPGGGKSGNDCYEQGENDSCNEISMGCSDDDYVYDTNTGAVACG